MRHIDFTFSFDATGRTAKTSWSDHKRDLLLQFLLTQIGERVNRPDFGTPLPQACFEGNSDELAEVTQFIAKAGLQRWLGNVVEVIQLETTAVDAELRIELVYRIFGETIDRPAQFRMPNPRGVV